MSSSKTSDAPVLRSPTEEDYGAELAAFGTIATGAALGLAVFAPFTAIALVATAIGSVKHLQDCEKRSNQLDKILKIRK